MFTGLIQALGKIKLLEESQVLISLASSSGSKIILEDLAIGDSVAVDGVCLTVIDILAQGFVAIVSPETLQRSTLGQMSDRYVNLETSLRAGSKLGGHFVTGHIDGVGRLETSVETINAWEMRFTASQTKDDRWQRQIAPYIVSKGSIAVNGISLTVADCDLDGNWFEVAVIPHSFNETNLCHLKASSLVNIEVDILGKYVAKFLRHGSNNHSVLVGNSHVNSFKDITPEFLSENGFI
ncbi:MAG: riboflavin synthase [Okeania sp. SIO2G4]|uniref:riboflavin synthase n=1 Tax=unclassified Okeania TaxID=2634635 RepID=UPI0013B5FC6D|nr:MULTISPECIES: riboflavin synthase [unclassified Okeania]NEP40475.1 riboflavin synthase [Okeania sp. SIO2H7]NEP71052.1 riboflavin synthase [Okeania sp. SIO2G5]NEP91528.1 riboflavin synthase [Okeania sp. SIO2F5]NEQ89404.1 riboflavin synthase [Okeania sp. SIO2G4]